jgi:hypothetical protein
MSKDKRYIDGASKCPKCHKYTVTAGYCPPCDFTLPSDKCPCNYHRNARKAA